MKIRYLGHSCFALTDSAGSTVVTDPYGEAVGFSMPAISADAVTLSHSHFDHNFSEGVKGDPVVFASEGHYAVGNVQISTVKSAHDNVGGKQRGQNLIFRFCMDGMVVCHFGDLGEDFSEELVKKLLPVDILLLPVGGNYTIGAATAKRFSDAIAPAVVIPMHYKVPGLNVDIDSVEPFLSLYGKSEVERANGCEVELSREKLLGTTKIIVLERDKV